MELTMPDACLYIFPEAFPALALAHFMALLSPGPDFFLIIGHAARHRLKGSAFICMGIAAGNAVYISLAILGWTGLKESPGLYRLVELSGAVYLLWMALKLWQSSRRTAGGEIQTGAEPRAMPPPSQLAAGLASALLNPKNAVFYLALMTVIIGPGATLLQQAAAGTWMALLVLGWDLLVAGCMAHPSVQGRVRKKIPLIEKIAALVLAGLAVGLLASMFWRGLRG